MKTMQMSGLLVAFSFIALQMTAQPVGTTDIMFLFTELPPPPSSVAEAYERSYADKTATRPNAKAFYTNWLATVDASAKEINTLAMDFYRKNPLGAASMSQPTARNVSSTQQASMQSASMELAQKMMSDPAFAQKFKQMSEQEQRAYITQLMANKGITPVEGAANRPVQMPAGLDVAWAEICQTIMAGLQDRSLMDEQIAIEQRFEPQHEAVNQWGTKEIEKLPVIVMGEYGRDHDPEKVKAITQKMREKHAAIADSMMREMTVFLIKVRQQTAQRFYTLNNEIKKVNYGKSYNFGLHYSLVLQTQALMVESLNSLLMNEIGIIESCAKWEMQQRMGK